MEPVQSNYSYQNPPAKKQAFVWPLNMIVAIVISLILGLGAGVFAGQMFQGSFSKSGAKTVNNAVFTSQPTYIAPVEGTLLSKGDNKITLEKNGSKLEIEVPMNSPALIQDSQNPGQVATTTVSEVEVGSLLRGSVQVSEQFMAGKKGGKVTASSFFVTKK